VRFKLKNLFLEPYRLFFLTGPIYAFLSIGIWFAYFFLLEHGISFPNWRQGPPQIHSHVMIYGVIGFYVFGFILTAFPRFVNQPLPSPRRVFILWLGLFLSQVFLMMGTFQQTRWMVVAAVLEILSYFGLWGLLLGLYRREGKFRENSQPIFILIALFFGFLGSLFFYLTFAFHLSPDFYRISNEIAASLYLLLLVISITYRIVPFFTGRVVANYTPRRGRWTLEVVLALMLFHLVNLLIVKDLRIQNNLTWIFNIALLFTLAREWRNWLPPKIRQAPILMVLYVGLSWILLSLAFSGFELVYHFLHLEAPPFPLFTTPALHALFVGAFGTLLLGISTRVVRGHGGLPIVADPWMLIALLLMQTAAIIRVFFPVLGLHWPLLATKNYWAGIFWCTAFAIWAIRYLPILGRPKLEEVA
jgi:uncharacterized protein involved in response to NO